MKGFAEESAAYDAVMTKAQFLAWIERQEGKYEWKDGRVVMTNVSKAHARTVSNILFAVRSRLDQDKWSVTASDLGVETEDAIRYPDLIVEPLDDDIKGKRALTPAVLFEVQSPSTASIDFTEKQGEYTSFASLEAYLIVSQNEPIAWIWERQADRSFPRVPAEVRGLDASLALTGRGLSLPLTEFYRGIKLD